MLMLPDFRVRQRDFLLQISRAMTARLELDKVLRLVLQASSTMLGADVGLIALRTDNEDYRVRATLGINSESVAALNDLLAEFMSVSQDESQSDFFNTKLKQMAVTLDRKLKQSVALPLKLGDELLGLLIIFRTSMGTATSNDIQILQSFADQAAIAVNNAQLYQHIDHERKRLAAILENSADGVMFLDADLHILRLNRALERITGWRAQDTVWRHHDAVIVWKKLEHGDLKDALEVGWPFTHEEDAPDTLYVEGDLERYDGLTISVGITYAPLFAPDGQLVNLIANVRDITNFRKAQEMQNVFVSGISHELKTPVALIKGYAGTLRREDVDWTPEMVRQSATVIEDEADRLTELINNLLAASKLQAEQMRLDIDDIRLDLIAEEAVERFRTQSSVHQFTLNFPADYPSIQGDAARLRRVLDNLLSNAIKYSPNGGTIEVGGADNDHAVTLFVRDQGIGFNEAEAERIFDRFYRVDGALSRKTQGTGLGLYLAKAIVDAHNGTIRVESKPGAGSTFTITIPIEQHH